MRWRRSRSGATSSASEVKTAVETIVSTPPPAPEEKPAGGAALAQRQETGALETARPTPEASGQEALEPAAASGWVTAARWTARVLGTLLLGIYCLFVIGEGLPPIGSQPEGVQLSFVAVGLMLLGFVVGWKKEGTAALLIASGWTLWHIAEGRISLNAFQTPLPVAVLYGLCWWATQGRKTHIALAAAAVLVMALTLGRLICPTSVFVRGLIIDAETRKPIPNAELTLERVTPSRSGKSKGPNARSGKDGRYILYVGWYAEQKRVSITAPGYATLTTNLGPRALGQRNVSRDYQLQKANAADGEVARTDQRSPDPVLILRDNMALDLDAEVTLEVSRERQPDPVQLSRTDVGWDNDGGGALMRNPYGKARLLPLPDASDFSDAVAKAAERRNLVAGSEDRGDVAKKCRFFAVLTDQARLAVIEVKEFDAAQGTIRWRFLQEPTKKPATVGAVPATGFSPTIERVLYSVGTQRPIKAEDLDSGREIEVPPEMEKAGEDQFFHWLAGQGADVLAFAHKQSWELWASPKLVGVPSAMWGEATADQLRSALKSGYHGFRARLPGR